MSHTQPHTIYFTETEIEKKEIVTAKTTGNNNRNNNEKKEKKPPTIKTHIEDFLRSEPYNENVNIYVRIYHIIIFLRREKHSETRKRNEKNYKLILK